ncbi:tset complex member tstf [Anaeramoeba flamelloides]|uniref:Tset complex member tstf n=1 Tax=Anaeramoeba flamelloides TaxID=1746091 RepID=A0AAV7YM17_9EUKA|nr:tset complex member tstf [Anaeramoeba flamelloides]
MEIDPFFQSLTDSKQHHLCAHPTRPWVVSTDQKEQIFIWNYATQQLEHSFSLSKLSNLKKLDSISENLFANKPTSKSPLFKDSVTGLGSSRSSNISSSSTNEQKQKQLDPKQSPQQSQQLQPKETQNAKMQDNLTRPQPTQPVNKTSIKSESNNASLDTSEIVSIFFQDSDSIFWWAKNNCSEDQIKEFCSILFESMFSLLIIVTKKLIIFWDYVTQKWSQCSIKENIGKGEVIQAIIVPIKTWIVLGFSDGTVRIFDYLTLEKLKNFQCSNKEISSLQIVHESRNKNSNRNAKKGKNSILNKQKSFEISKNKNSKKAFLSSVNWYDFFPIDPFNLLVGSEDGTLVIWSINRESLIYTLQDQQGKGIVFVIKSVVGHGESFLVSMKDRSLSIFECHKNSNVMIKATLKSKNNYVYGTSLLSHGANQFLLITNKGELILIKQEESQLIERSVMDLHQFIEAQLEQYFITKKDFKKKKFSKLTITNFVSHPLRRETCFITTFSGIIGFNLINYKKLNNSFAVSKGWARAFPKNNTNVHIKKDNISNDGNGKNTKSNNQESIQDKNKKHLFFCENKTLRIVPLNKAPNLVSDSNYLFSKDNRSIELPYPANENLGVESQISGCDKYLSIFYPSKREYFIYRITDLKLIGRGYTMGLAWNTNIHSSAFAILIPPREEENNDTDSKKNRKKKKRIFKKNSKKNMNNNNNNNNNEKDQLNLSRNTKLIIQKIEANGVIMKERCKEIEINNKITRIWSGLLLGIEFEKTKPTNERDDLNFPIEKIKTNDINELKNNNYHSQNTKKKNQYINSQSTKQKKKKKKFQFFHWDLFQLLPGVFPSFENISFDPTGHFCLINYGINGGMVFHLPEQFRLLHTISNPIESSVWFNGTLFIATSNKIIAYFFHEKEIGQIEIASFEPYKVIKDDFPKDNKISYVEKYKQGIDTFENFRPTNTISLITIIEDQLCAFDQMYNIHLISLNFPLVKFRLTLQAGMIEEAVKWASWVTKVKHQEIAYTLENRGFPKFCLQLDGLSLSSKILICSRNKLWNEGDQILLKINVSELKNEELIIYEKSILKFGKKAWSNNIMKIAENAFQLASEFNTKNYQYLAMLYKQLGQREKLIELFKKGQNWDENAIYITGSLLGGQALLRGFMLNQNYPLAGALISHQNVPQQNQKKVLHIWNTNIKQTDEHNDNTWIGLN